MRCKMANVYAKMILASRKTIEDVPEKLRTEVLEILILSGN